MHIFRSSPQKRLVKKNINDKMPYLTTSKWTKGVTKEMIEHILNITYFIAGLSAPIVSQSLASRITRKSTIKKRTPKEILGTFYCGQALKLAMFTTYCLSAMLFAKEQSNIVMFGVISGIIIQKTIETRKKPYASHLPHTN